jgi:hypothetical protein
MMTFGLYQKGRERKIAIKYGTLAEVRPTPV